MQVKVSGKAIEESGKNQMHIVLTNITPERGSTAVQCNAPWSGVFAQRGGDKASFSFDMLGLFVEPPASAPVPLPGPIVATVHVRLVDLSEKSSPPK